MAHELDIERDGTVRMAYAGVNGTPWHKLGIDVGGLATVDEMLMASGCGYEVVPHSLFIVDSNGNPIEVPDKFATTRTVTVLGDDGFTERTDVLGVVGSGYEIEQNASAAAFALDCVAASQGDAVVDTMGALRGGREFFVYLRLEPLFIDPNGVNDKIEQGLCVRNGHDGGLSLCAYPTATRVVCWNTATWSMEGAARDRQIVRVRHTKNKEPRKTEAVAALGLASRIRDRFVKQAEELLARPASFDTVRNVAKRLWDTDPSKSKRAETIFDNRIASLERLWISDTNSGGFGMNKWSAWNTITEYLDHSRSGSEMQRAMASISIDGFVAAKKDKAAKILLGVS
jgi:phage/plasmid-like protein (TIGR03299 family)